VLAFGSMVTFGALMFEIVMFVQMIFQPLGHGMYMLSLVLVAFGVVMVLFVM